MNARVVRAGIAGGAVMAVFSMMMLWLAGSGFWTPLNLIAPTFWRTAHLLFGMLAAFFAAISVPDADTRTSRRLPADQAAARLPGHPPVNRPRQEAGCGTFWLCQVADTPAAWPGGRGVCLAGR